jgi:predicted N-acyltransferase
LHDDHGLAAAAPVYVKLHSFGEFVFDQSWAHAYAQHGLAYYPKLAIGVPFTPATGPRLLVRPDLDAGEMRRQLIVAVRDFAEARRFSSIHALFVNEPDRAALAADGWLARHDVQFHWHNRQYRDFDHYLEGFTAEKRKKVKRERRRVAEQGIHFDTLLGRSIDGVAVDEIYALHRDTFLQHGNEPYLSPRFFRAMPDALGDSFMVKRARYRDETVAAAVFFWSPEALYGRYWGAARDASQSSLRNLLSPGRRILHRARHRPLRAGNAGIAQGEPRFRPAQTSSMHWIVDARFREAIGDYLKREGPAVDQYAREIAAHVPYRDARREARGK